MIDVLREKHPEARVPCEDDFDMHPGGQECLESPPIYCYEENVAKAAARLSGGAGPCGVDGIMLTNWMLRFGAHSENLRAEIAEWVCWLSNGSPPYAAYRALNTVRELAADKRPGVRPLGCGETWIAYDCKLQSYAIQGGRDRGMWQYPAMCRPAIGDRSKSPCCSGYLAPVCGLVA